MARKNGLSARLHTHIPQPKAKQIYAQIRKKGTVSKTELADNTNLTLSTLTRILDDLTEKGLILEAGLGDSTGGRRPILYRINPTYGYVFGLDLSRTYSTFILFDLQLNPVDSVQWTMTEAMTPDYVLRQVVQAAEHLLHVHNIPQTSILGMGIGAVGPLDRSTGTILEPIHYPAPGWQNIAICDFFEQHLDIPVLLDNGANTAVLGEFWSENTDQVQHLVYIHAGIGLRSGVISNGEVVYGATDMEGAIGHMIIQTDGPFFCRQCRNYGCWESYTALPALHQQMVSRLKQGRRSTIHELTQDPEHLSFAHLFTAVQNKDPLAIEIFTQAATYFGIGLANLLHILHPEKVILGGPLVTQCDLFYEVATEVALEKTAHLPSYSVRFSRGNLGEDALATGAAVMVVKELGE